MRIWGEAIIKGLIYWLLAFVTNVRDWQPLRESLTKVVEIPRIMAIRAPVLELRGARLSRGPTGFNHRSDL
jgi:hypothetical protein